MKKWLRVILILIAITVLSVGTYVVGYQLGSYDARLQKDEEIANLSLTPTTPSKYDVGPPDPQEILELVNAEREKVGVAPLRYDERLETSAQLKSDYMAKHNLFQHELVEDPEATLTPEMGEYVTQCVMTSENYVYTPEGVGTTSEAMDWWKNSKPHYDAIKSDKYTSTGIGVTYDDDQNGYYAVQHFCIDK